MKKLIMGLGLSAIVGFSAAASAGQCTMQKLQGAYALKFQAIASNNVAEMHQTNRVQLNKNGTGKVTAAVYADNGDLYGDYVTYPVRWQVGGDCTGAIEITVGNGLYTGFFVVTGNPKEPVIEGVMQDSVYRNTGPMEMKKIRF